VQKEEIVTQKEIAIDFLKHAASGNVRDVYKKYIGKNFIHHNPYFHGDAESLMIAMEENAIQNPGTIIEIQHALHEGDLVAVHSKVRMKPDDAGIALVHLFRFKNNLIEELWDIAQAAPDNSPNDHGMF
jgi:predicted SnoaL-like aldol condensation-catalyzing enzyme